MAAYLLDSSTFSHLARDAAGPRRRLAALDPHDRVVICAIVRGEVLYGLGRLPPGRNRGLLEAKTAALFVSMPCEPVAPSAAEHYARLRLHTERRGRPVGDNDLWIAAVACDVDATLVAEDSDFDGLPGLRTESWTQ